MESNFAASTQRLALGDFIPAARGIPSPLRRFPPNENKEAAVAAARTPFRQGHTPRGGPKFAPSKAWVWYYNRQSPRLFASALSHSIPLIGVALARQYSSVSNRLAPRVERSEKLLIGAVLISQDVYPNLVNKIKPEDFGSQRHEDIWRAMDEIFNDGKEISLVTVGKYAKSTESHVYLVEAMNQCPSSSYYEEWADDVRNAARLRGIISAAGRIAAVGYEEKRAEDAEDRVRSIVENLVDSEQSESLLSPARQGEVLKKYIQSRKESNSLLVRTGFPTLDTHCGGGFRRGDLIVVAARTSVGKSTYAENLAENVANNGERVLFVSVEMTPEQMLYRYAIRSGKIPQSVLEYGINDDKDNEALEKLQALRAEMPFFIYDAPTATVASIRAQMSRMRSTGPLSLVVVDYLQLLADVTPTFKEVKEHLRIGQITKSLKHLAREYNVPIILISQLNRNLEYRGGEPRLADLRESGRIEEDADLVLMLWELEEADANGNATRLKIAKNRQGPQGPLPVIFDKPTFTFLENYYGRGQN